MGILHYKGIIKGLDSISETNKAMSTCEKFESENKAERKKVLKRFEKGELIL